MLTCSVGCGAGGLSADDELDVAGSAEVVDVPLRIQDDGNKQGG